MGGTSYLLVPGVPGSAALWAPMQACCPADARLLFWPLETWRLDDHAGEREPGDGLAAILSALRHTIAEIRGPLVLVGHSFGAWLIARLLADCPQTVVRAVLISGMARVSVEHAQTLRSISDRLCSGELDGEGLREFILADAQSVAGPALDDTVHLAAMIAAMGTARIGRLLRMATAFADPAWAVQPYTIPTEVIHLADDRSMPLACAQELARLGQNSRLTVWPGSSHFPQWHYPDQIMRLMVQADQSMNPRAWCEAPGVMEIAVPHKCTAILPGQ